MDSLGWTGTSGGLSAAAVTARALGALQPREIVLMHVGSNPQDARYRFVTLDALLT